MQIGWFSLPVVGLTAIFTGGALALQIYAGGARFNAEAVVPSIVAIGMARELGPVLGGLMVAARVASSIAAEIGTMKVTEQIDALVTLSTNPMKYLTVPACPGRHPAVPVLVGGAMPSASWAAGWWGSPAGFQLGHLPEEHGGFPEAWDIGSGLVKGAVFGFIVALMGCYHGMNSARGAQGVGRGDQIRRGLGLGADPGANYLSDRGVLLA
jgi:phospholipid/cholesterol/gamma-HCH transport system permease protein